MNSSQLALLAGLLLAMVVGVSAVMHSSMIDACVCVVNSAARASIALSVTTLIGAILGLDRVAGSGSARIMHIFQILSFTSALFFLIQHVFFVLQLA